MMLLNLMVRLLAAVALAGLWVGPAVCMDVSQIINSLDTEPAAISATYKKIADENIDQEALPNSVVSSNVLPRSAINLKELMNIFNIADTYNESRVLSQPLNYYELPDGESLKRDFMSDKNVNVAAESLVEDFSSAPLGTVNTLNVVKDNTISNVSVKEKCVHGKEGLINEVMSEFDEISKAMVYTFRITTSTLKNQLETVGSNVLEFGKTMDFNVIIFVIIFGVLFSSILLYISPRIILNLPQERESLYCEEWKNSGAMGEVYLSIQIENDNLNSHSDVHANDDDDDVTHGKKCII